MQTGDVLFVHHARRWGVEMALDPRCGEGFAANPRALFGRQRLRNACYGVWPHDRAKTRRPDRPAFDELLARKRFTARVVHGLWPR